MSDACAIVGVADLYGLGIRLGFYFQWLSTLLVTIFRQEEEALYRVVNLIFQLAVMTCLVFLTASDSIHASEVVISVWLLMGALSSLTGDGIVFLGTAAGTVRILFYAALSAYSTWFWFVGLDRLSATSSIPGCDAVGWFGRASMRGPLRDFSKAASIVGLAACAGMLAMSVVVMLRKRDSARVGSNLMLSES
ncbi:hypothetical protein B0T18DRAFT_326773 [Schizothecium vesticola]|uniref:Transmembrane protein n=1 Tax=Schizothecium vesticola TaxID=314040 RepID=A0AA40EX40_9PEZI|nr:hypothetical protein B0T18DRAFT_326773 [Schizothecium vesticola]